jgi:hypothetical protein
MRIGRILLCTVFLYLGDERVNKNCWNLIKGPLTPSISPGFYSQTERGRGGGDPTTRYPSQEVSSLSPDHVYSAARNYSAYRSCVAQNSGGEH